MTFTDALQVADSMDRAITLALNFDGGAFQNSMWWAFSSRWVWVPMGVIFLYVLLREKPEWRHPVLVILGLVLTILLCDRISSGLIKPMVERMRPCRDEVIGPLIHIVNGYKSGNYGFVSSHAANAFGAMVYVSLVLRRKLITVPFIVFAVLVSYSRVYLGVHYFGDVVCGAALGAVLGYACFRFIQWAYRNAYIHRPAEAQISSFGGVSSLQNCWLMSLALSVTILVCLVIGGVAWTQSL